MKKKPESKQYYDIWEIIKYYGWKDNEISDPDTINGNGCLMAINKDLIDYPEEYDIDSETYKNQVKILKDFGECEIKVWW